jgi:hypothetical protein
MPNKLFVSAAAGTMSLFCHGEYDRYQKSLDHPEIAQEKLLEKLVGDLSRTRYGREHGIIGTEDYREFTAKIPIQAYEDLEPWIERQLVSDAPILTPHRIVHVEPTSGSSAPVKHIPYTRTLLRSFSDMFCIWAYDQLRYGFVSKTGRMFISISPSSTSGGFGNDDEYVAEPLRSLVSAFLVTPPKSVSSDNFRHQLARTLLCEEELEVISIWSPSYLLVLLAYIQANRNELSDLLRNRRKSSLMADPICWQDIWPHLKLISCWDSALAEPLANQIRASFPNVQVQGKGLLATEAPITIPLINAKGCVPLVRNVFLEFESADGTVKLLHELTQGQRYQLIISQSAGLTRYRLNDVIEVVGTYRSTPLIKFIGRSSHVCDMTGEKLHEYFVRDSLTPLIPSGHFLLIPYQSDVSGYVLLVDYQQKELAERADKALCQSHHYKYARFVGQLSQLRVLLIPDLLSKVKTFQVLEGVKLGSIKDVSLITDQGQARRLLTFLTDERCRYGLPQLASSDQNIQAGQSDRRELPLPAGALDF